MIGFLVFFVFAFFAATFIDEELVHIEYKRKYLPDF